MLADALSDPWTRPTCWLVSFPVLGAFSYNHKNRIDGNFLTNVTMHLPLGASLTLLSSPFLTCCLSCTSVRMVSGFLHTWDFLSLAISLNTVTVPLYNRDLLTKRQELRYHNVMHDLQFRHTAASTVLTLDLYPVLFERHRAGMCPYHTDAATAHVQTKVYIDCHSLIESIPHISICKLNWKKKRKRKDVSALALLCLEQYGEMNHFGRAMISFCYRF